MTKIGITERGDSCLDFTWVDKLSNVDGAIIISKGFNDQFKQHLLNNQDKIIYHCTITGLGNTIIEPNVLPYKQMLINICNLVKIDKFPVDRIVLRIDPLLPINICNQILLIQETCYIEIIENILKVATAVGIKRIRYSYLDIYNHVKNRFLKNDIIFTTGNTISDIDQDFFQHIFSKYNKLSFECCGEDDQFVNIPKSHLIGCISEVDYKLLNIKFKNTGLSKQRLSCRCCSGKTELLDNNSQCEHNCLYCYWKNDFTRKLQKHNNLEDL